MSAAVHADNSGNRQQSPLTEHPVVSSSTVSREPVEPNSKSSLQNLIESDPFPSSLIECLTVTEVYAFIEANPVQASHEFLEMDWKARNELRQLTQGSIDNLIMGKRQETLEDMKPYLGLLSNDRLAKIESLKREHPNQAPKPLASSFGDRKLTHHLLL